MDLFTSFAVLAFMSAMTGVHGGAVTYVYKENSLLVSSEVYFFGQDCLEISFVNLVAGDNVYKRQGSKKIKSKTAEVYGTVFTDCTDKGATKSEFSLLYDGFPKVDADGVQSASVSIATTALVQKSSCTVNTLVDPDFGQNYTYYSCCEGETLHLPLTLDLAVKKYGNRVYKEHSNGIRKGLGFFTKFKSSGKCAVEQEARFSNFVLDDVSFPEVEFFNYGKICQTKEGSSSRYTV